MTYNPDRKKKLFFALSYSLVCALISNITPMSTLIIETCHPFKVIRLAKQRYRSSAWPLEETELALWLLPRLSLDL